jgi:hypothetical protein
MLYLSQEVGGTLIGEDWLVEMASGISETVSNGFHGFAAIPFTPFQKLL